jgi:fatty acid desaturase
MDAATGDEGVKPLVHDIPIEVKATLADDAGIPYRAFRSTLRPRWGRLWSQIAAGYLALAAVPAGLAVWEPDRVTAVAGALGGALVVGYVLAYINNFFHESAHHNLLPSRRANDLVTNLLMAWLFGSSIAVYREIHWQHHRSLGTTMDSENSYFDPLRIRYLIEGLTGLKVLRTLRRYREIERGRGDPAGGRMVWTLVGAVVNLAIVAGLIALGAWAAAVAWALGLGAVFPFFVSLRQTLEHRAEDADPDADYTRIEHGAVNRLFGDGPLASTLGSAGFNRHALHHWEPQVSCTRIAELERFLDRTELAPLLRERRTSYRETFLRLLVP